MKRTQINMAVLTRCHELRVEAQAERTAELRLDLISEAVEAVMSKLPEPPQHTDILTVDEVDAYVKQFMKLLKDAPQDAKEKFDVLSREEYLHAIAAVIKRQETYHLRIEELLAAMGIVETTDYGEQKKKGNH